MRGRPKTYVILPAPHRTTDVPSEPDPHLWRWRLFLLQRLMGKVDTTGVDGIMIGCGALIKSWIFTEIKERREWDISSRERLEVVRKVRCMPSSFLSLSLSPLRATPRWSSGFPHASTSMRRLFKVVTNSVRPGGETRFRFTDGTDDAEMLFASPNSQDWVRISEMFLRRAPETWTFTSKHKSNACGEESQA
jgi:tRNA-dihydrouridine synthase 3